MKSYLSFVALASLAFAGAAHAHAHLEKSQPVANSTLTTAPKTLDLELNEAVQVTALTLQAGDAKPQDIGPLPKAASSKISLPLPALAAGSYTVTWRALGEDNHMMSGKILFKIGADTHAGMAH